MINSVNSTSKQIVIHQLRYLEISLIHLFYTSFSKNFDF